MTDLNNINNSQELLVILVKQPEAVKLLTELSFSLCIYLAKKLKISEPSTLDIVKLLSAFLASKDDYRDRVHQLHKAMDKACWTPEFTLCMLIKGVLTFSTTPHAARIAS